MNGCEAALSDLTLNKLILSEAARGNFRALRAAVHSAPTLAVGGGCPARLTGACLGLAPLCGPHRAGVPWVCHEGFSLGPLVLTFPTIAWPPSSTVTCSTTTFCEAPPRCLSSAATCLR